MDTAGAIAVDDPESAFVLAYDAARFVGEALLAQQGLRPTQAGGHLAVSDAVRAQFGGPLNGLGALRRRRNELEYPAFPGEHVEIDEVTTAITTAQSLLDAAHRLAGLRPIPTTCSLAGLSVGAVRELDVSDLLGDENVAGVEFTAPGTGHTRTIVPESTQPAQLTRD